MKMLFALSLCSLFSCCLTLADGLDKGSPMAPELDDSPATDRAVP